MKMNSRLYLGHCQRDSIAISQAGFRGCSLKFTRSCACMARMRKLSVNTSKEARYNCRRGCPSLLYKLTLT
uniref:Uncharacterized protein n=1 Tax=Arundo donax TaxID=35708 RepID=A0A0A9DHW7_ARUDO